jgi:hypothetical protein
MMQELSVVHIEQISRKAEIKYFQIPLPGTVKNIIAVETSCVLLTQVAPIVQEPITSNSAPPPDPNNNPPANNCPNPGQAKIDPVSDTVAGNVRTQVFQVDAAVNPEFIYQCGVYSVVISVTAVDGDTPTTIATKLADAVNNTTLATWNQYGSNNNNYKPSATVNADQITLKVDYQHSFFAAGIGECFPAPPPPPPPPPNPLPQYDLLFFVSNNEKAGVLSLQSPDATDIFYQTEVFREDKNIGYGDFTFQGLMPGEWLKGKKRFATDVSIRTASPILEGYYKDRLGVWYNQDLSYQLSIFIWYEKEQKEEVEDDQ